MNALILVDIQNDFVPGGALPVTDGGQIVPVVNLIRGVDLSSGDVTGAVQEMKEAGVKVVHSAGMLKR